MKHVAVNGLSLAYEELGDGNEAVVLSHSYLVDRRQFDAQIEALSERYRVLAFDHRGHGGSDRPASYHMESVYADAVAFIEATDAAPCHFVGLSTGGFVGLRLALRRPELLRSLVLMDTSADAEPAAKRAKYFVMLATLRRAGFGPVIAPTMKAMFGSDFLTDPERAEEVALWRDRITANDVGALVGFGRAIFGRDSVSERLWEISVPTLVMVGDQDRAQPPELSRLMADGIRGAHLKVVEGAGHLSTIERPTTVNEALIGFFDDPRSVGAEPPPPREPRSVHYDGRLYAAVVEPLLAGVHDWVVEHLPDGQRVLEACCGTGGLAHKLGASGREVRAVDLSPRNIDYAQRHRAGPGVTFEVADASRLDENTASFDVATVVMSLHEMPHAGQVAVLRELGRVARRVLIVDFAVPQPRNPAGVRNRILELAAGRTHYGNFGRYCRLGGLDALVDAAELQVLDDRKLHGATLRVVTATRAQPSA